MLPQQVNPSHREDIATAPYNFVPLPDRPLLLVADHLLDQDVYDPARYTGSIACSLTTETPTFVRAPLPATTYRDYKPQEEKQLPYEERTKNKPAFFHTGDPQQPLIPGSTLRGHLSRWPRYGKVPTPVWATRPYDHGSRQRFFQRRTHRFRHRRARLFRLRLGRPSPAHMRPAGGPPRCNSA